MRVSRVCIWTKKNCFLDFHIRFCYCLVRKSYHQLSLTEHPDRVPSAKKEMATARFQVLTKLYDVLMDQKRRDLYDAEGVIADEKSACMPMPTYKITSDHIAACKAKFVGTIKIMHWNSRTN